VLKGMPVRAASRMAFRTNAAERRRAFLFVFFMFCLQKNRGGTIAAPGLKLLFGFFDLGSYEIDNIVQRRAHRHNVELGNVRPVGLFGIVLL
jgi:hypothetical protein